MTEGKKPEKTTEEWKNRWSESEGEGGVIIKAIY